MTINSFLLYLNNFFSARSTDEEADLFYKLTTQNANFKSPNKYSERSKFVMRNLFILFYKKVRE